MYPPRRPRRRHVRSPTASPRIAPIGAAPGGRLLAGLDNSFNYTVDDDERRIIRGLPFSPLRDPSLIPPEDLPEWGMQFSHTLDEQIRGQIQAGFRIVDLYEDTNGEGRLHELGIPTFWATCAEKPAAGRA